MTFLVATIRELALEKELSELRRENIELKHRQDLWDKMNSLVGVYDKPPPITVSVPAPEVLRIFARVDTKWDPRYGYEIRAECGVGKNTLGHIQYIERPDQVPRRDQMFFIQRLYDQTMRAFAQHWPNVREETGE